jgi:hypothetical protein
MRRVAILLGPCLVLTIMLLAPAGADAAFAQCPPVSHDTACQFLITVTAKGVQVAQDPAQTPYDGEDDALIGIQNSSAKPIASIPLSAENTLFGFESDGICHPGAAPNAPGCVVPTKDASGNPNENAGTPCTAESSSSCAFPSPAGEPPGVVFTIGTVGFGASGDALTGYEGPGSYFTNISATSNGGVVNFSPPLAPGAASYFGLESPPTGKTITVGSPTTVTTILSGGGQKATTVTVAQGTPVTDSATVAGVAAATSTGEVSYAIYKDAACTKLAAQAGAGVVNNGVAGPSAPQSKLAPGTYYWLASYSGDINNQASASVCGSEKLVVARKSSSLGLPSSKKCVSKRHFIVHPRAPRHVKLVHIEVRINGKLTKSGSLTKRHSFVDLRGLPKGTFHVELITTSSSGQLFGDGRTFHTCVPKKGKKH